MALSTAKYKLKAARVDAVQVTSLNMEDVAEWANGKIHQYESPNIATDPSTSNDPPVSAVMVPTLMNGLMYAREGMWVLKVPKEGMHVMGNVEFNEIYEAVTI